MARTRPDDAPTHVARRDEERRQPTPEAVPDTAGE
jgi:hypothetical protein